MQSDYGETCILGKEFGLYPTDNGESMATFNNRGGLSSQESGKLICQHSTRI